MKVADAMTPRSNVVTAQLPGTRDDVLEVFQERSFSSVPVVKPTDDGEVFRGIISREELIDQPEEDQLAILMRDVPVTTSETEVEALARLMLDENERRIPVVDGKFEGIVTVTDVVRAIADGEVATESTVAAVLTTVVNTTYCETPLPVAERELSYANVPYSVVLDEQGDMIGILTEVDIIEVARVVEGEADTGGSIADEDDDWMWEGIKSVGNRYLPTSNVEIPTGPVREFMSDDVLTISRQRTVQEAAQLMITNDIEQIPVVGGDGLVGIVRDTDVLRAINL